MPQNYYLHNKQQPGNAGMGGKGGKPGNYGVGGMGGNPGVYTKKEMKNNQLVDVQIFGKQGVQGSNGVMGNKGTDASHGQQGTCAHNGLVMFRVCNHQGQIVQQGTKGFNVVIESFKILEAVHDGIVEPGSTIWLDSITVRNNGDMALPAGAALEIVPNMHSEFKLLVLPNQAIYLPEIPAGHAFILPYQLEAQVEYKPITNVKQEHSCVFSLQVSMLQRVFDDSVINASIPIEYPLELGGGESYTAVINIRNKSQVAYGSQSHKCYDIQYRVTLCKELHFLQQEQQDLLKSIDYINAETSMVENQAIILGYSGKPYEQIPWKVELLLRNQVIDSIAGHVKIVPHYNHASVQETDLLLITNIHFTDLEFAAYTCLFAALQLKANYWDMDKYKGLSIDQSTGMPHYPTWVQQYQNKIILLPLYHFTDPIARLQQLLPNDIVSHFQGDSAMVLLCKQKLNFDMKHYLIDTASIVRNIKQDEISAWHRFSKPAIHDMRAKCEKIEVAAQKNGGLYIVDAKFNPAIIETSYLTLNWRYCYGTAVLKKLPLDSTARMLSVEKMYGKRLSERATNDLISMDSEFFTIYYTLICSLSLEKKILLLQNTTIGCNWRFFIGNVKSKTYDIVDLLRYAICNDLTREFADKPFTQVVETMEQIVLKHLEIVFQHQVIYSILFAAVLADVEAQKRKKPTLWNSLVQFFASNEQEMQLSHAESVAKLFNKAQTELCNRTKNSKSTIDIRALQFEAQKDVEANPNPLVTQVFDYMLNKL